MLNIVISYLIIHIKNSFDHTGEKKFMTNNYLQSKYIKITCFLSLFLVLLQLEIAGKSKILYLQVLCS